MKRSSQSNLKAHWAHIMNRIISIALLLSEVLFAEAQNCFMKNNIMGYCLPLCNCLGGTRFTLNKCGEREGGEEEYCCPEDGIYGIPTEKPTKQLGHESDIKYPPDCGYTPIYSRDQITGGYKIEPDQFSWMASLQYGTGNTFGDCSGSVINERYVLTAAHCVTGKRVQQLHGLTGVRLGDFTRPPYCDYGTSNCILYQHFGIAEKIVHEHYTKDEYETLHNDIALLRLNRPIRFDNKLKPICLPFNMQELDVGTIMTVSGWGTTLAVDDNYPAKRSVYVPLWKQADCTYNDEGIMCAGSKGKGSCDGDSGGPLMHMFKINHMVLEGIVSQGHSTCGNSFFPVIFTNVRKFLNWIDDKMQV